MKELIYPIFVIEGEDIKAPVPSMPGIYQWSPDRVDEELDRVEKSGIAGILIFGIPAHKDETASVIKSSCKKLSGWGEGDLTESGRLVRQYFHSLKK